MNENGIMNIKRTQRQNYKLAYTQSSKDRRKI